MSVKVITVGREFGSGGRSVGKAVATALGWDYYDQELVRHVAEKTGFAERYIEETGEYSASKSRLAYAFSSVGSPEVMNGLSASDYLWTVQRKVILDLAEKGNCVIVGRCADYILEDRDADGIASVNKDTEQDEDSDLHGYQCSDGSQRTERCENHHRLFDVRLLDDPDTEAHVRDKGYETDARLDDSVVGGSKAQLCL